MQDRPTAPELLDAVSGFLRERAEHARDRWERFQLQVAANSVGIVARELEMEDGFLRAEWKGLDGLLGAEQLPADQRGFTARLVERNQDLSARITRGEFDGETEGPLLDHLWQTITNKVRITNPNMKP